MIEACLKSKTITKFLKNYKEKKWISIIPSLLEIAILNLYNTFKKTYYSENDLSSIIKKLSNPKKLNKLRNDYHLDIYDSLNKRRYSYQSLGKKVKNINELNVYSNGGINDTFLHNYYKSSEATPIKRLINSSETEGSLQTKKFKSFWKFDKIINSNNKNNNKNNNAINYNTIDINSEYRNYKKYLSSHNDNFIDNNNSNIIEKEYIKVNKVHKTKKLKDNTISVEDLKINSAFTENIKNKIDKINKNSRIQLLNNYKQEDIFLKNKFTDDENIKKHKNTNYNLFQKQNISSDKINKYSIIKDHSISNDFSINETKKIKIKNIYNKINMKKITMKEIRNKQLSNLNRNKINNNNTFQNININPALIIKDESFKNFDDINFDSNIKTEYNNSKIEKKIKSIKGNPKSKTINYNSFNKDIYSKNRTFINDPYFLIKPINKKEIIIKK